MAPSNRRWSSCAESEVPGDTTRSSTKGPAQEASVDLDFDSARRDSQRETLEQAHLTLAGEKYASVLTLIFRHRPGSVSGGWPPAINMFLTGLEPFQDPSVQPLSSLRRNILLGNTRSQASYSKHPYNITATAIATHGAQCPVAVAQQNQPCRDDPWRGALHVGGEPRGSLEPSDHARACRRTAQDSSP